MFNLSTMSAIFFFDLFSFGSFRLYCTRYLWIVCFFHSKWCSSFMIHFLCLSKTALCLWLHSSVTTELIYYVIFLIVPFLVVSFFISIKGVLVYFGGSCIIVNKNLFCVCVFCFGRHQHIYIYANTKRHIDEELSD